MFAGKIDQIATPEDSIATRALTESSVELLEWIPGGHISFLIGKDMTWFEVGAMNFIKAYHQPK